MVAPTLPPKIHYSEEESIMRIKHVLIGLAG
jgi:hypothetical protein